MFPWVFNIADVFLLLGMVLLLVHVQLTGREERKAEEAASSAG